MDEESASRPSDLAKIYKAGHLLQGLESDSIWLEVTTLIEKHQAVSLAAGFPDYISYHELKDVLIETSNDFRSSLHQYTRICGHPRLVEALATYYSRIIKRQIDAYAEILVAPGTDGALNYILQSLADTDDEFVIIEPFYMNYNVILSQIIRAKCKFVTLKPKVVDDDDDDDGRSTASGFYRSSDWVWDDAELEAAFSSKTKAVIINTPSNPLGKVLTPDELAKLASLCVKYNVICISDEVYHTYVLDESKEHVCIASLPGMWERTMVLGSSGKLFGSTGFKTGWILGHKNLISLCSKLHSNTNIVCPTFNQEVIARCIEKELARLDSPDCYFNRIKHEIKAKRDYLAKQLMEFGLEPVIPDAGFYIIAKITKLTGKLDLEDGTDDLIDRKFIRYLIKKGVGMFPCSVFFSDHNKELGSSYIRICFVKENQVLDRAVELLKSIKI